MSTEPLESLMSTPQDVTGGPDSVDPAAAAAAAAATPSASGAALKSSGGAADGAGEREADLADGAADSMSPAPLPHAQGSAAAAAAAAAAARLDTPTRHLANGERQESSSRAASAHPEAAFAIPSEAAPNGAAVRQYINSKLTGPLLDGMKLVAKEQPRDPLRVLGEYLLQRSRELEGTR